MRVLVVEDEKRLAETIADIIEEAGDTVDVQNNGEDGYYDAVSGIYDAIVLDVMLPGMDGVELLKKIRASAKFSDLPVIMATAKGTEYEKIQSLDLGADDYIVKPFGVMELISRIKSVLRRCRPAASASELTMGGIGLHLDERTLTIDGERVQVTYKEFELLRLFMNHPGIAFTRDQLFSNIWGMDYAGETRTVDMHIRTLRQKLGKYGELIETVRHIGYRMEKIE